MSDNWYFAQGNGVIEAFGEIDVYPVELTAGTTFTLGVSGASTGGGTLLDPTLLFMDANGALLGYQDDSQVTFLDPYADFVAPYTGTFYIGVTDLSGGTGSYAWM